MSLERWKKGANRRILPAVIATCRHARFHAACKLIHRGNLFPRAVKAAFVVLLPANSVSSFQVLMLLLQRFDGLSYEASWRRSNFSTKWTCSRFVTATEIANPSSPRDQVSSRLVQQPSQLKNVIATKFIFRRPIKTTDTSWPLWTRFILENCFRRTWS